MLEFICCGESAWGNAPGTDGREESRRLRVDIPGVEWELVESGRGRRSSQAVNWREGVGDGVPPRERGSEVGCGPGRDWSAT